MLEPAILTSEQCRAARALIGWSRHDLAAKSLVAVSTLADFESGKREPHKRTILDVRRALEEGGVMFQGGDAERGAGVSLVAGGRP